MIRIFMKKMTGHWAVDTDLNPKLAYETLDDLRVNADALFDMDGISFIYQHPKFGKTVVVINRDDVDYLIYDLEDKPSEHE